MAQIRTYERPHAAGQLSDEELQKLPKWAQAHIDLLYRRLNDAQQEIEEARGEGPTRVYVEHHTSAPNYLRSDTRVTFDLAPRLDVDDYRSSVAVRVEEYRKRQFCLEVMGRDTILIVPQSSNLARLIIDPDL